MNFAILPFITPPEWIGAAILVIWGVYKKEIQDVLNGYGKRLWAFCFVRNPVERVSEAQLRAVLGSGLEAVETLLYLLLKEYRCDRATVTEYEEQKDGSALVTCVAEVRAAEMKSVRGLQQSPLSRELWQEIQRLDHRPDRVRYVPDAHTVDSVPLRTAMLASGAWSAYYQLMPPGTSPCRKVLSLSWHTEHRLAPEHLASLYLSGTACATVLLLMDLSKPTTKP